jgi:hypothetical protein
MKIENKTNWNTKELRKLFSIVCKNEGFTPEKVEVIFSKRDYTQEIHNVSGYGGLGYGWVKMLLPNKKSIVVRNNGESKVIKETYKTLEGKIIKRVAQVFAHEIGHNLGLRHKEMIDSYIINVDYINGMIIHRTKKNKKDIIINRYKNTIKNIDKWKSKIEMGKIEIEDHKLEIEGIKNEIERANKFVNKWEKKKNYYENNYKERVKNIK